MMAFNDIACSRRYLNQYHYLTQFYGYSSFFATDCSNPIALMTQQYVGIPPRLQPTYDTIRLVFLCDVSLASSSRWYMIPCADVIIIEKVVHTLILCTSILSCPVPQLRRAMLININIDQHTSTKSQAENVSICINTPPVPACNGDTCPPHGHVVHAIVIHGHL